jgi:hypothetical protein|tara:strand:- start:9860 stop:10027 length:168 start_codon:yes stop_codon:yes gene_type:complete
MSDVNMWCSKSVSFKKRAVRRLIKGSSHSAENKKLKKTVCWVAETKRIVMKKNTS